MAESVGAQPQGRGPLDRPLLDWLLAAAVVFGVTRYTPVVEMWVATDSSGQRSAMGSTASLLGGVAAFGVAALFAYSALDNPTTQKVRARWGGHLAGVFLRGLGVIFLCAVVAAFTQVSVPNPAGVIVFFSAVGLGAVKLLRLLIVVAALLGGQRRDARKKLRPVASVVDDDPESQSA